MNLNAAVAAAFGCLSANAFRSGHKTAREPRRSLASPTAADRFGKILSRDFLATSELGVRLSTTRTTRTTPRSSAASPGIATTEINEAPTRHDAVIVD